MAMTDSSSKTYVITREGVESLTRRLLSPKDASRCRPELQKMLEIKEVLSWRSEAGPCCAARAMAPGLYAETRLLEAALHAFDRGDFKEAAALLTEFSHLAEGNGSFRLW